MLIYFSRNQYRLSSWGLFIKFVKFNQIPHKQPFNSIHLCISFGLIIEDFFPSLGLWLLFLSPLPIQDSTILSFWAPGFSCHTEPEVIPMHEWRRPVTKCLRFFGKLARLPFSLYRSCLPLSLRTQPKGAEEAYSTSEDAIFFPSEIEFRVWILNQSFSIDMNPKLDEPISWKMVGKRKNQPHNLCHLTEEMEGQREGFILDENRGAV